MLVEGDGTVSKILDQFQFVLVAFAGEVLHGIGLGDIGTYEGALLAGELLHLGLDILEIGIAKGAVTEIHIVVEPVLDGWAYAELDARIEHLQGFGQQVRTAVPEGVLSFSIIPGEQ